MGVNLFSFLTFTAFLLKKASNPANPHHDALILIGASMSSSASTAAATDLASELDLNGLTSDDEDQEVASTATIGASETDRDHAIKELRGLLGPLTR